ncbi:hypothetical protein CLOSTMETH_00634 [[Clostridium] methylpentosum DSM 5476]|uniref:Uncharacterized protein n=1 Tax=[Clostridium] methylpentosum DSM 5476 TaxID=537013 RepID=C0E9Y2_9FIRM|nr:hypothetical protein CLOSTMETH_00634 [[Clostridium] methylpentosum DSM 5476]
MEQRKTAAVEQVEFYLVSQEPFNQNIKKQPGCTSGCPASERIF